MSSARRPILIALAAITAWYGGTLAFWAIQPLTDSVPVGIDYTLQPPKTVSIEVECNSLFESTPHDDSPLPTLTPQPVTVPPVPQLAYQREPCELVHSQAQKLFVLDTASAVILYAVAGWLLLRSRRSRARADHSGHAALAAG